MLELNFEFQTAQIQGLTGWDETGILVAELAEFVAAVKAAVRPEVMHMDFALLAAAESFPVSFVEYGSVKSLLVATGETVHLKRILAAIEETEHLKRILAAIEEIVRSKSLLAESVATVVVTVPNHLVVSLVNTSVEFDSQSVAAAALIAVQKGYMTD